MSTPTNLKDVLKFTLMCVRHGETSWNTQHLLQGQTDIPLNSTGQAQASDLGVALSSQKSFHLLYSSDLCRASETAKLALQGRTEGLRLRESLRERHFGVLEGKHFTLLTEAVKNAGSSYKEYIPEGGESGAMSSERIRKFFEEDLCKSVGTDTSENSLVAVFAHGAVLKDLFVYFRSRWGKHWTEEQRKTIEVIGPNVNVSKFKCTLSSESKKPLEIIPIVLHDISHLN